MKLFTLACTAVLSLAMLSLAHAADPAVPTQVVKFGDLDLSRTEGNATLYDRLVSASRLVCRGLDPSSSGQGIILMSRHRACLDKALTDAVANVNRPDFTAYAVSKRPTLAPIRVASR
jgi:UrcA family protein